MNNILVTGSNGQLGSEIKKLCHSELDSKSNKYFFTNRDSLDILDEKEIKNFIELNNINTIINCGAYTAVDKAENDVENANSVNNLAVKYLAEISKENNISLVHISTDYVFDGRNYKPYKEDDKVKPIGVYGQTKLYGENALLEVNPKNSIIIRTSWVYSSFGANFVKTMLRLGKDKDSLGVIYDQVGTPTYAKDLAKTILDILPKLRHSEHNNCHSEHNNRHSELDSESKIEIYHYSNEGVLSWYDFAKEIMRMAKLNCIINPIESKDYPTPVTRPHYSVLNKSKIKEKFNIEIPYWKDSLDECLKTMGERK